MLFLEAWRTIDRAYIDKTFNGQSWFRYRESALRNEPMNTRAETCMYFLLHSGFLSLIPSVAYLWGYVEVNMHLEPHVWIVEVVTSNLLVPIKFTLICHMSQAFVD